jgi:pilus assembly protein CpaC
MGGYNSIRRGWVLKGAALALALFATPAAVGQPVRVLGEGAGIHGGELIVPLNKSQVLRVDRPFAQALIGNPEIADLLPLTNQSLYVLGKQIGTTSLTLYDRNRNLIAVVDVVVGPDVISLRRQLAELIPGEEIGARLSNDTVVLTGTLSNGPAVQRAVEIAQTYAPEHVINMMSVGSTQQVMLEVRFSEMRRSAARQLGFNHSFINDSGSFQGGFGDAAPGTALLTNQNGSPTINLAGILEAAGVVATGFDIGSLNIFSALDALERRGIVTTLAEPTLIALSGETASFLAGGEFPIPVAQGGDNNGRSITVQFKPFGVSLSFTPTVLADGVINLVVAPEVSSIDTSASISVDDIVIPGLQVRRARTTLELRDGQSFAMAGLLRRDFRNTIRQFPLLGSIPVIGALFRSSGYENNDTELVIIVTPRLVRPMAAADVQLPTDRVQPSNDADLFLMGRTDTGVPYDLSPAPDRTQQPNGRPPLARNDARPQGVEGPYGQIVE